MENEFLSFLQSVWENPQFQSHASTAAVVAGGMLASALSHSLWRRCFGTRKASEPLPAAPAAVVEMESEPEPEHSRLCSEALAALATAQDVYYNATNHCLFVPGLLVRFACEDESPAVASVLVSPRLKNGVWEGTEIGHVLDHAEARLVYAAARERRAGTLAKDRKEKNERLGMEMAMNRLNRVGPAYVDPGAPPSAPVVYTHPHWAAGARINTDNPKGA